MTPVGEEFSDRRSFDRHLYEEVGRLRAEVTLQLKDAVRDIDSSMNSVRDRHHDAVNRMMANYAELAKAQGEMTAKMAGRIDVLSEAVRDVRADIQTIDGRLSSHDHPVLLHQIDLKLVNVGKEIRRQVNTFGTLIILVVGALEGIRRVFG